MFKTGTDNVEVESLQARPRPLITYGNDTEEGEYPWHAALYHVKEIDLAYICGASLISNYHVITVAHCVTRRRSQTALNPKNLVVYLGKLKSSNCLNSSAAPRFASPTIIAHQTKYHFY